jgi:predicted acylesterase/phospholipase RssA
VNRKSQQVQIFWDGGSRTRFPMRLLLSYQPAVLFSQNEPATSRNQPAVLFSQNKPTPAISHQPTEHAPTHPSSPSPPSLGDKTVEARCGRSRRRTVVADHAHHLDPSACIVQYSSVHPLSRFHGRSLTILIPSIVQL